MPTIVLVVLTIIAIKNGLFSGVTKTAEVFKGLNDALEKKLNQKEEDHKAEIDRINATHKTQLDGMQQQINALMTQVKTLEQANQVYQNTVTGKETLAKIIEVLTPVPALFAPGGILETFKTNDEKIIATQESDKVEILRNIDEIKGMLGDKRNRKSKNVDIKKGLEIIKEAV